MSRYTFLRVEVDSGVVKRILDATPGVDVVDDADAEPPDHTSADRTDDTEPLAEAGGFSEKLPDEDSAVRQYGLLGVGVSFVLLGVATVGIWWYRRRGGADETDEHTEFESAVETPTSGLDELSADEPSRSESSASAPASETDDDLTLTAPSSGDEADTEAVGRTEDDEADTEAVGRTEDRDEVEWTTKQTDEPEPTADEDSEASEPTPDTRTDGSVDVAPLLGVAFVAISGAVVRWLQGEDEQSD